MDKNKPIITDQFVKKYAGKHPNWGFNGLGYIIYKRTYSRLKDDGLTEEWWETVQRCINGAQKIGAGYTQEEAERLYDHVFHLRCNFAGRMLWQLGTSTVDRFGLASLLNCWFCSMRDPEDFCFLFEHLMLGGGVGFSVKKEDIHELPRIHTNVSVVHEATKDADFIVPDSRGGWVQLLRNMMNAYFVTGKSFTYSTILIRSAGEHIKGFGGIASGPKVLVDGIVEINKVFKSREGKKLRSIDVLDICNIIGSVVVAGNVRRSAEVAIGDPDDYLYLRAKRWDIGDIPNWRAMSNNSIYADSYDHISDSVWEGYEGNGEPYGFMNLPLSRKYGRLGEERKDNCEGGNPCMEITLADGEACNLCEIYLNNISTKEQIIDCAKLLYKCQKAIWNLPALYEKTQKIVSKNRRIGLGVTGICQSLDKLDWLDEAYLELRKFDEQWSLENNIPTSVKLTTVKPSGTLSLLAGSTPGVHPAYSKYYIRRVRMASNDKLVQVCRDAGYHVEYALKFDNTIQHDTVVVSFPCQAGENTLLAKDMTAIQQLELVKKLQTVWSDNSVSVTVYYRREELPQIKEWLKNNYKNGVKTISFLLHNEHGFKQAPYEEITKDEYTAKVAQVKGIKNMAIQFGDVLVGIECEGGVCPIR
jgi:ribonucleotide reductase alpha subunit